MVIDGPVPVNGQTDAEGGGDGSVNRPVQQDPQLAEAALLTAHELDSIPLESTTPAVGGSARPCTPLPTAENPPILHTRNVSDQASEIQREIEGSTAEVENLDLFSPSPGVEQDGTWSSVDENRLTIDSETAYGRETDHNMKDSLLSHEERGPSMITADEAPILGISGLLSFRDDEQDHNHIGNGDDDAQSSDDPNPPNVKAVATPETSNTENDAPYSDSDEGGLPETPESTSSGDEPAGLDADNIANLKPIFWDRIGNWLWHIDENIILPAADIEERDESIVRELDGELPFVPAHLLQADMLLMAVP